MQSRKYQLLDLFCIIFITISVIPGFLLLGNLFAQVTASAFSCIIVIFVFDLYFKLKPLTFARSLSIMTLFWIVFALILQVARGYDSNWFNLFYYDKPAMMFVVQITCIVYFIIKLVIKRNDESFITEYSTFIKHTTICFVLFYLLMLIFCFIIVREVTFIKPTPNMIPFNTINNCFAREKIDYELIFLVLGNVVIFLPLGIFVSALIKNKLLLLIFPIILSVGIEVSQYCLGNGHPDIDDVLLNIAGFYIGISFNILINFILTKSTDGRIKTFFIF